MSDVIETQTITDNIACIRTVLVVKITHRSNTTFHTLLLLHVFIFSLCTLFLVHQFDKLLSLST